MLDAEFGGTLWLVVGELAVVVMKTLRRSTVKAGPEGRFADDLAAGEGHGLVVVSGATDHVGVWFDIRHFGRRL